jgi:hypothetical protein
MLMSIPRWSNSTQAGLDPQLSVRGLMTSAG